jgi:hypothetical protein
MNTIDIFCNQVDGIDNQTDAQSLAFQYLPFLTVSVDGLGFLELKNKNNLRVRLGLVGKRWRVMSTPFRSLVERDNSNPKEHLNMLVLY